MKNTTEKVIVVAGGTGGIGSAACRLLASRGATIIVASRKNARLGTLSQELKAINPKSLCLETDLCSLTAWNEVIGTVVKKFRRIDVLVNCAGELVPGLFERLSEHDIGSTIDGNLVCAINGARAVIPAMRKQGFGHIINVGSLGGITPMPFESLYSATKFAVRGLSLSLAEELRGSGIRVSVISCGPVSTRMLERESRDDDSTIAFVNKPLKPMDVAEAILKIIRHPKREITLPGTWGRLALLLSPFANFYAIYFPLLSRLGRIRQEGFRIRVSALKNVTAMEN